MIDRSMTSGLTRRELLRGAAVCGGALLWPEWAAAFQAAPAADALTAMRNQMGAAPIQQTKLGEGLTMLGGPGGNVIVLDGRDGKIVVDTFVLPAWTKLKATLDGLGPAPVKSVIDTHWHYDHADNNENFRKIGAAVIAHANTAKRLAQTHELLGMRFEPAPPGAMPTETFADRRTLDANGEQVVLGYIPPAHTDTDIYIRFTKANVLHLGDVFFIGTYPFIDASTGGTINGMIAGADFGLKLADASTKIVPGHGPLVDRAALTGYRDMLAIVRDRVQKLKSSGRSLEETVAANPTKEFDATWGKGFMPPKNFVGLVYGTL